MMLSLFAFSAMHSMASEHLGMTLFSSDAESQVAASVNAGVSPNIVSDSSGPVQVFGTGVPESALASIWNDLQSASSSGSHAAGKALELSQNLVSSGKQTVSTAAALYSKSDAPTGGAADSEVTLNGRADSTWTVNQYGGSGQTWVEGQIFFSQQYLCDGDTLSGGYYQWFQPAGYVEAGDTELSYYIDLDGTIHVSGSVRDLNNFNQTFSTSFPCVGGVASGSVSFREYVQPGSAFVTSAEQSCSVKTRVSPTQPGVRQIGNPDDGAQFSSGVTCEARSGTPD
jgi:hypothetical protein